jgi:serine phosphatase RsbU (regulator of sigma subunit)
MVVVDIPDFGDVLRALRDLAPAAVIELMVGLAEGTGATDVVVYLVDFGQIVLSPLPAGGAHVRLPEVEAIPGSVAGRAFTERRLQTEALSEGTRVWVPVVEGSECTGVLAFTVSGPLDDRARARCLELGLMVGCAVAVAARHTDLFNLVRRRRPMSLPASMQWDLLPPLHLQSPEVVSAAVLEPAYDVGGDSFDHAINGGNLDLVIVDAMGHGLAASMTSALAMGSYRHDRREGQPLATMHRRLDEVIGRELGSETFATGLVARLVLATGHLTWINAGHPQPLLVRAGRVQRALACRPSLPWGLGSRIEEEADVVLEAGDSVLFYTDGVVEGRAPGGEPFGVGRLIELIQTAAAAPQPSSVLLRQLIHQVLIYQDQRLRDDATLVWLTWNGPR